jgi:uncharacterized protein YndB with AHSA1/START domain
MRLLGVNRVRPPPQFAEIDEWLGRYRALWERRVDALKTETAPAGTRTKEYQMTSNQPAGTRILGSLRAAGAAGVVRIGDHYDTDIDDLWSALTDPGRLASWYGQVEGDLRPGGEFHASIDSSGWEGTGRVEACEPPRRLLVTTRGADEPYDEAIEATLIAGGDQTILVIEARGMPLDLLAAYGAGYQIHAENLAAHLAGRERVDSQTRWAELAPSYEDLAANIG